MRRVTALLCLALLCACATQLKAMQTSWKHWGGDLQNRRYADITCLDTAKLKTGLKVKWMTTTDSTAFSPPAVCNGGLYTVDWNGYVYKFDAGKGGKAIWRTDLNQLPIKRLMGLARLASRSTPILSTDCKTLFVGLVRTEGAWMVSLDAASGKIGWWKQIESHKMGKLQQSGVFFNNAIYIGVASATEGTFTTPTFRGSMVKVDAATGKVLWKTSMCPLGFTGCAIWGSSPVIDQTRNQVCIGTGNNYNVPAKVLQCRKNAGTNLDAQAACGAKDNYVDSIVCMDRLTGKVRWSRAMNGLDVWLPENRLGPDYDFAQAPILVNNVGGRDLLIATSKSGQPVAVDPANGKKVWGPLPQEFQGFAMFGSCSNGPTYCHGLFWFTKTQGAVICIDSATGKRKWRWFIPNDEGAYGPLTCTKKAVFAPLMNKKGSLMVFDINTGKVLGQFDTGKPLFSGPSIVNGVAYFGTGYVANGGLPDNKIYALSLPLTGQC